MWVTESVQTPDLPQDKQLSSGSVEVAEKRSDLLLVKKIALLNSQTHRVREGNTRDARWQPKVREVCNTNAATLSSKDTVWHARDTVQKKVESDFLTWFQTRPAAAEKTEQKERTAGWRQSGLRRLVV